MPKILIFRQKIRFFAKISKSKFEKKIEFEILAKYRNFAENRNFDENRNFGENRNFKCFANLFSIEIIL